MMKNIYAALRMMADLRYKDLTESNEFVVCSECFQDVGLKCDAAAHGVENNSRCPNCSLTAGRKLDRLALNNLTHQFFVQGTLYRQEYGAAPLIAFNEVQETRDDLKSPAWLKADIALIGRVLGVGFFEYGPRLWMIGEVEPLMALQAEATRPSVVARIIAEYPAASLSTSETFFRLRKAPKNREDLNEYDSPPIELAGTGRLDSIGFPVMYGSQDLQICVHESRVTAEDDLYVATLRPNRDLKFLDLAYLLPEDVTEFESLDMAIHMLFLAGKHAYPIARDIALAAHRAGFDGLIYPSYFSLLRTGGMPFETVLGVSFRKISNFAEHERSKTIRNLGIFGRPIAAGLVQAECVNKLIMHRVEYGLHFGPMGMDPDPVYVEDADANVPNGPQV